MKKNYTLFAASLGLAALVSCSDKMDEGAVNHNFVDDQIGFISSTSRATVIDIAALKDDNNGFNVYATNKSGAEIDKFIDGANYLYGKGGTSWHWGSTSYSWPTDAAEYPITFYALYLPSYDNVAFGFDAKNNATLSSDITIGAADSQMDMLRATSSTNAEPVGGNVTLDFAHILSRVNFNIVVGDKSKVYVIKSDVNDFADSNTYDAVDNTWDDKLSGSANYNYISALGDNAAIMVASGGSIDSDDITNSDLMLMPQLYTVWDKTSTTTNSDGSPILEGSRIELLYRMTDDSDEDYLGYTNAGDHPDFSKSTSGLDSDEPLFIKIAMPLAKDGDTSETWVLGNQYLYVLKLATSGCSNGYYADNVYYDEEGARTDLRVIPVGNDDDDDEEVEIGKPVTTGEIGFDVTVGKWNDGGTTNLN